MEPTRGSAGDPPQDRRALLVSPMLLLFRSIMVAAADGVAVLYPLTRGSSARVDHRKRTESK